MSDIDPSGTFVLDATARVRCARKMRRVFVRVDENATASSRYMACSAAEATITMYVFRDL